MEPKHTWLLTNLQLLLYRVPCFSFYGSFFPQSQIVVLHIIKLQKEHWAIQSCWGVCVSTLSFPISSIDCLVSRHNYLPYVAMATRKSISLMLWTHCTLTTLKMLLPIGFDLGCFLCVNTWTCLCDLMFFPREELQLCRQNIESLMEQRDDLEKEIERQKAAENKSVTGLNLIFIYETFLICPTPVYSTLFILSCSVTVFRLRAQHKYLCQKLQSEEELEGHINTELKQQEWAREEKGLTLRSCSDRCWYFVIQGSGKKS